MLIRLDLLKYLTGYRYLLATRIRKLGINVKKLEIQLLNKYSY